MHRKPSPSPAILGTTRMDIAARLQKRQNTGDMSNSVNDDYYDGNWWWSDVSIQPHDTNHSSLANVLTDRLRNQIHHHHRHPRHHPPILRGRLLSRPPPHEERTSSQAIPQVDGTSPIQTTTTCRAAIQRLLPGPQPARLSNAAVWQQSTSAVCGSASSLRATRGRFQGHGGSELHTSCTGGRTKWTASSGGDAAVKD